MRPGKEPGPLVLQPYCNPAIRSFAAGRSPRRDPEGLGLSLDVGVQPVDLLGALQRPRLQQSSYGRVVAGCADVHPRCRRGGRGGYDRDARCALSVCKPVLLHGLVCQGPQQTHVVYRPVLFFGHNRLLYSRQLRILRYQVSRTGAERTSPYRCSPKFARKAFSNTLGHLTSESPQQNKPGVPKLPSFYLRLRRSRACRNGAFTRFGDSADHPVSAREQDGRDDHGE